MEQSLLRIERLQLRLYGYVKRMSREQTTKQAMVFLRVAKGWRATQNSLAGLC